MYRVKQTFGPVLKNRKKRVRITGTVTHAITGEPLLGADIILVGLDRGASSQDQQDRPGLINSYSAMPHL